MAELSQAALEELVEGIPQKPRATFYEKAALQIAESRIAGKRVYKTRTYVKMIQSGVTDNISYIAKQKDMDEFPEEYSYFLRNKQGTSQAVLIDIIPNLSIAHKQELVDMGLSTIDRLADAEAVPPHLEHIRQSAKVFQQVLQEQSNVESEDNSEESIGTIESQSTVQTEDVPAVHGSGNGSDVGQSPIPSSGRREQIGPAKGLYQARQVNSDKSLIPYLPDVNWSISL
jgi:hypothetical protein